MGDCVHRIRRQRWSVRADSPAQALAIRLWLREHCDADLQIALESAFDRVAPDDRVVRLHRLVVHLRLPDLDRLLEVLPAKVVDALATPLRADAREGSVTSTTPSEAVSDDERLIAYLLTGGVAWPLRPDAPAVLVDLSAVARARGLQVAATLARRVLDSRALGAAVFRLLQLVDEDEWPAVVSAAGGASRLGLPTPTAPAEHAHGDLSVRDRKLRLVVSRLIDRERRVDRRRDSAGDVEEQAHFTSRVGPPAFERIGSKDDGRPDHAEGAQRPTPARRLEHDAQAGTSDIGRVERCDDEWEPAADAAFATAVAHAGLVLLHPYLPHFFRTVNVPLEAGLDPASETAARAAALLHFVATGRDEPYELELGFIKILLGLEPDCPLPVAGGLLTDADRQEADALLAAVVEHWSALKCTSPEAIRTSFLQRAGLVKADENGRRLRVEPGPFDVLLNRLPWSLAVVKLPWMNMPLHCEWTTP